jgi:hypothetical protein
VHVVTATVSDVAAVEGRVAINRCAVIGSTMKIHFVNIVDLMRRQLEAEHFARFGWP